jgi:hypothetical protein
MRFLAIVLASLLALPARIPAQQPVPAAPVAKLNLVVIEGEGAINNIRQRTARAAIVQVEDENRKPVAGATVAFLLPGDGASGTFTNGSQNLTTVTDAQGRATARLRPNSNPGQYALRVTASFQGQTASIGINMTNTLTAGAAAAGAGISTKLILILVGAGAAAAAGGAIVATRGDNGSTPSAITINPSTGSVGAPPR